MQDVIRQKMRVVNAAGIAIVALLVASTVSFGVIPLYKQGTQNISDAAYLKAQLGKLDGLSQNLVSIEAERRAAEDHLREVEKRLPSDSETNTFIKELAGVTRAAGIQVEDSRYPPKLEDSDGYKALPVEVAGLGDWDSCYRFLTGLRAMNRITRLDSLVLEVDRSANADPRHPMCHITVKFSAFFMGR